MCQTLDFGVTEQGDPVIVSELLEGQALDQLLLAEKRLPSATAIQLLLPIVDALAAAHACGIVHRDVKPPNIFLARDAHGGVQPNLLDFGIARAVHEPTRITVVGKVRGTPDYMSPEQARGASDVDGRSDIWSVCATLFELVSGHVPFPGDNYDAVMFSVINSPAASLGVEDAGLAELLARGLSKGRGDRFQSAAELARALAGLLLARGIEHDATGRSLRALLGEHEAAGAWPARQPGSSAGRSSTEAVRLTNTLESARTLSATATDTRSVEGGMSSLRYFPRVAAVLLMALAGAFAVLLYRSSARPETPATVSTPGRLRASMAEPDHAPTATSPPPPVAIAERSTIASRPSEPQLPTTNTAANRKLRAHSWPTTSASVPNAVKQGPNAAASSREQRTEGSRAPASAPNALGYDFGL